jgi:hypothetical protein
MPTINKISSSDLPAVHKAFKQCFPSYAPINESLLQFLNETVNWDISFTAEQDEQIVGFYLLGERKLSEAIAAENAVLHEDLSRYDLLRGIEGVALGVIPEFRKTGLTEKLKQQVKTIPDVDFIYGMQYKSLGNLDYWLRSRRLIAESFTAEPVYFTLEDVSHKAKSR